MRSSYHPIRRRWTFPRTLAFSCFVTCLPTLSPTSKRHTIYSMSCNNHHPLPPQDTRLTQSTIRLCDRKTIWFLWFILWRNTYTSSVFNLTCDVPGLLSSAERMQHCLLARPKLLVSAATILTRIDQLVTVLKSSCIKYCYRYRLIVAICKAGLGYL